MKEMQCHISVTVILLAVCTLVASNPDRNVVDCRKFVFAPLCRGVAAKRGTPINTQYRNGIIIDPSSLSLNDMLRNYNFGAEPPTSDDKENVLPLRKSTLREEQNDIGTFKKDKLHPDHLLYNLFLGGNRRSNNEVDNTPLYEYENL